jgi:hypothetical protein
MLQASGRNILSSSRLNPQIQVIQWNKQIEQIDGARPARAWLVLIAVPGTCCTLGGKSLDKRSIDIAGAVDRIVNFEHYIGRMTEHELAEIVLRMENEEEATCALTELSSRNSAMALSLSTTILAKSLGDEYVQAMALHVLYYGDREKAMLFMSDMPQEVPAAVLGTIMDCLSADSLQPFGRQLPRGLLLAIAGRYDGLDETERQRIADNYEWFAASYSERLQRR